MATDSRGFVLGIASLACGAWLAGCGSSDAGGDIFGTGGAGIGIGAGGGAAIGGAPAGGMPPGSGASIGAAGGPPSPGGAPPVGAGGTQGAAGGADPGAGGGGGGAGPAAGGAGGGGPTVPYHDPGTGPWEAVPAADVQTVCKLDPDKLKAAESLAYPWLIVRYGKLCYESKAKTFAQSEAWSTTKTLGALVTGLVAYQTKSIARSGKKTGPFSDEDRADQWLDTVTYNKEAKVGHVLGMVAHDPDLSWGKKSFAYDTVGATEINSLSTMLNTAIGQDSARLGANLEEFTKKFLYTPLGMTKSIWNNGSPTKVFAYSWNTDLYDMARVGLLILNYGVWQGQRLVDEEWIYRMTHPSFEDANTGFGYLTWLNSSSGHQSISGGKIEGADTPGTCAPVCIHRHYPHGISEAPDCNYKPPYTCDQKYDVGVWQAEGLGGQIIQGHRGLDIVIVARNAQPGGAGPGTAKQVWTALSPAVIAGDPTYKGDTDGFCKAYGTNNYAPDQH